MKNIRSIRTDNTLVPIQRIREIQDKLKIDHHIIYHQLKELCPLPAPIRHDFFSLILFRKAEGKHVIDGREYQIGERQLHMVFPGQVHYWNYTGSVEIYQIFVAGEVFNRLEGFMQFPVFVYKKKPVIELGFDDFQKLVHEFKDISDELKTQSPVRDEIIYSKMKIISQNISKEVQKNAEYLNIYESHPILFDFMMLLTKDSKFLKTKKYYADQLGVNANYLNILCKKYFDRTATEMIQSHIAEKIKYRLQMTQDSLKDVAFDFGFHNYGHFSGFMKKHSGLTPKRLRDSHQESVGKIN